MCFSQVRMEERSKALPSSFPSLLTETAFEEVDGCLGQPFQWYLHELWDSE